MAKFRVMAEQTVYTPYFKVFEAETMEQAEQAAEAEVEAMTMQQTLDGLGWTAGDSSEECEVHTDVTEILSADGRSVQWQEALKRRSQ